MHKKLLLLFVLCLFMCVGGAAKDGIPHVVKRFNLYNQTGPIGPIALYTPKHSGMFRVNTVCVTTVGNGQSGYFYAEIGFTDKTGQGLALALNDDSIGFSAETAGDNGAGTVPVVDEGGQPLTFSIGGVSNWQGAQYNVYIVVEEL
jgi:hypothetical protein